MYKSDKFRMDIMNFFIKIAFALLILCSVSCGPKKATEKVDFSEEKVDFSGIWTPVAFDFDNPSVKFILTKLILTQTADGYHANFNGVDCPTAGILENIYNYDDSPHQEPKILKFPKCISTYFDGIFYDALFYVYKNNTKIIYFAYKQPDTSKFNAYPAKYALTSDSKFNLLKSHPEAYFLSYFFLDENCSSNSESNEKAHVRFDILYPWEFQNQKVGFAVYIKNKYDGVHYFDSPINKKEGKYFLTDGSKFRIESTEEDLLKHKYTLIDLQSNISYNCATTPLEDALT